MGSIQLILLGSFLALVGSFAVEIYKEWFKSKSYLKNFKIILRLELKNLITVIDKLTESYSSKNYFAFKIIDQIDINLKRVENVRKDTIYLKEENKKEEILNYVNDIFILSSDLRSVENYAFSNPDNETEDDKKIRNDLSNRERQIISLRLIDLKRRCQDLVNYLEN